MYYLDYRTYCNEKYKKNTESQKKYIFERNRKNYHKKNNLIKCDI